QAPMIDRNSGQGVQTWKNSHYGTGLIPWFRIYDAQGIPGNIKSVKAVFPGGREFPLYLDYNENSSCGIYKNEIFGIAVSSGDCTVVVEDLEGNQDIYMEHLDVNPLMPVSSLTYSITGSGVDFSWDPVPGAVMYRLQFRDYNNNWIAGYVLSQTSCHVPEGFFKKNGSYRYLVYAYREFPENNISNLSGSTGPYDMPVSTPYPNPGVSMPKIDLNLNGVYVSHRNFPDADTSDYRLYFDIIVSDADGVAENIKKVEVTYPDGITKKELVFDSSINTSKAYYLGYEDFSNAGAIPAGEYTFRVIDADGNVSAVIPDILTVNPIPIPENLSPVSGGNVFSTSPEMTWNPVPGASFYRVKIYKGYDRRIYNSPRLPVNSFTVPPGILQQGQEYSYRVDAYRIEDGIFSNMSSSKTFAFEKPRFTAKNANSGITGRILGPDSSPLSGIEVIVENLDDDPIFTTTTSLDGSFSFDLDNEGEHYLSINNRMDFGLPFHYVKNLRVKAS
ncbi:MAG: carboxypeptidase-like regulatory domain-containing protein, partial [Desulfobacula sp.]